MPTRNVGPQDGSILVHTFREGMAGRVGHDLVLEAARWTATVDVGADGAITALAFEVDGGSLRVLEGRGGVKPLSEKDRDDIRATIDAKVVRGATIAFHATEVRAEAPDAVRIDGRLTIGDHVRPLHVTLTRTPQARLTATVAVTQSAFGITPYRAMMGALRVRDDVEVVVDVALPAG